MGGEASGYVVAQILYDTFEVWQIISSGLVFAVPPKDPL